jgi:hypothetical protein
VNPARALAAVVLTASAGALACTYSRPLDAAGVARKTDSAKRRARSQYGATLRDAAGDATYRLLP